MFTLPCLRVLCYTTLMISHRRTSNIGPLISLVILVQASVLSPAVAWAWTDADLSGIQSSFSELQSDAMNARHRQGVLEEQLKHFDEKVSSAKDRFQTAAERRSQLRTEVQHVEERLRQIDDALSDARSRRARATPRPRAFPKPRPRHGVCANWPALLPSVLT